MKNLNSNKIKFFLVATALVLGGMTVSQTVKAEGSSQEYDFNGDPNADIGVPGTSVTDNAFDKPIAVSCCADCGICPHDPSPLGKQFGPNADSNSKTGDGAEAKQ